MDQNKCLIMYDLTGRVWGIYGGETEVPEGVLGFIADIDGKRPIESIELDMSTTPPTPHIVYGRIMEDTENDLTDVQLALMELDERIAALEEG